LQNLFSVDEVADLEVGLGGARPDRDQGIACTGIVG
jgi:hypothetical protein